MEDKLTKQEILIQQATEYYNQGDYSLGYRMLLDATLNTDKIEAFKAALTFVETYEKEEDKSNVLNDFIKCKEIINGFKIEDQNAIGQPILKGNSIEKVYRRGKFKLGPINIELNKGDIFGLVGENGNGKTTLLTILASLIEKTSGNLSYSFLNKTDDIYDLKSKLVYIPQRTSKWYGSVIDNLKFALVHHGVTGEKNHLLVHMMIARFGLWKYKDLKWSELSSGYKMRFELARTMLRKPEIVLLDEPLANLDILAQQVILEDLKMLAKSHVNPIAMIFSSQQLYEVEKVSDEVIYLRNGKPTDLLGLKTEEENSLIIELDTTNSREDIEKVFEEYELEQIEYNGGVYIIYFKDNTITFNTVLSIIASNNFTIQYIRDISKSTRRFFVY
ncbi:ATP-binding cassette domain-containing protein [uncultured Tenacibaculum sp.]|uniref:ABC transporter ATP-binding protein n=1 Tax=uncultured Tenacibaculum sp. TaxID=174713 RepID=UPI00261B54F1|nr:ABC transporter ATP-binding protein [uncultured Tenacibaculum sp.]